jgi:hypothetical protein
MPRTTQWYRGNYWVQPDLPGSPVVIPLATFVAGETLIRSRLDLEVTGFCNSDSAFFPNNWSQYQVEAALLWDEGDDGGDEPPGYFDTALFPWIWAQQLSFQTDSLVQQPFTPYITYATYINTGEGRSIDCHSQRVTSAGSSSTLWFVLDAQVAGDPDPYFYLTALSVGWSVMSKLPA